MKLSIILVILLILIGLYLIVQDSLSVPAIKTTNTISGIQELMLNEQDLQLFGLGNGTDCQTEESYTNIVDSSPGQYSICIYSISSLNDTQVIIELKKFTNYEALNGSYQYDSQHLYSREGLISENDYGDQSRFRVNNENDYMGQYNDQNVYYYHLWIVKNEYLIHITSGGSEDVKAYITEIGHQILSKFG